MDLEKERERESLDANAITVSQQWCDMAHELTSVNRKVFICSKEANSTQQRDLVKGLC